VGGLRVVAASSVVPGPCGVAIRDSLKGLTEQDEKVLRLVGDLLGSLASRDLKARCAAGLEHDSVQWAERKRALTGESSSRWAGSITKATHDQWALARRGQLARVHTLQAGVDTITYRLSLPVGAKGSKGRPGGYRSKREWFAKSRRLHLLEDRLEQERARCEAGRVRVVRGGKKLLRARHNLQARGAASPPVDHSGHPRPSALPEPLAEAPDPEPADDPVPAEVVSSLLKDGYARFAGRRLTELLPLDSPHTLPVRAERLLSGVPTDHRQVTGVLSAAALAFTTDPSRYDDFLVGPRALTEALALRPAGTRRHDETRHTVRKTEAGRRLLDALTGPPFEDSDRVQPQS
jgi:hypothetical protein